MARALVAFAALVLTLLASAASPRARAALSPIDVLHAYPSGDVGRPPAFLENLDNKTLMAFIKALEREGPEWVVQDPRDIARRRLTFAALVLDVADATPTWRRIEYDQTASVKLLRAVRPLIERACELIRQNPTGEKERLWFLASVAVAQGAEDLTLLAAVPDVSPGQRAFRHLEHARFRLPSESRLKLANAEVLENWDLMGERLIGGTASIRAMPVNSRLEIIGAMQVLLSDHSIAAEAELHIAFQQFLMGDATSALASFKKASDSEDPYVRYLAYFLAGRMLDRLNQPVEAEQSFTAALQAMPHTSSGVEALSAKLTLRGRYREAETLVEEMFASPNDMPDPWSLFPKGDYRRFPALMQRLREELRR